MATQLQMRRGTQSEHTSFTGAEGEVSVNTTNESLHVHNGSAAGGFELARADLDNVSDTDLNAALTGNTIGSLTITTAGITNLSLGGVSITSTAAELNFVDGVTSAIQTQIDTKAPLASPAFTGTVTAAALTVDTDTLHVDATNNRVGIGTISPKTTLNLAANNSGQGAVLTLENTDTSITTNDVLGQIDFYGNDGSTGGTGQKATIQAIAENGSGTSVGLSFGTSPFPNTTATERARLDASGNLLVGTTDSQPFNNTSGTGFVVAHDGYFSVTRNGTVAYFNRNTSNGDIVEFRKDGLPVGSIASRAGVVTSLILNPSGSVGAGITEANTGSGPSVSPTNGSGATSDAAIDLGTPSIRWQDLYLSGGVYAGSYASFVQGGGGDLFITNTYGSGDLAIESGRRIVFKDSGSEAGRFDGSGNLLVGETSAIGAGSEGVQIHGNAGFISSGRNTTGGASHHIFYNPNGVVGNIETGGSATSYNTSSDQRLKENIVDAPSASADIDAIQVRSFDWKADGSHQKYGMVAQELQTVAPEAVSAPEDPEDMMGVDYSKLVPMLVKEIQSLRARVAQLENN